LIVSWIYLLAVYFFCRYVGNAAAEPQGRVEGMEKCPSIIVQRLTGYSGERRL
jgi:hypothetical protein